MKASFIISGLAAILLTSQAHASRQAVTCTEVSKSKNKIQVLMNFDPSVTIETIWKNHLIETIKLGAEDQGALTTARVGMVIPASQFKAPYSGRILFTDFYDVNTKGEAGSGYSYKFDNQAYRGFHGHDKDQRWDAMVYLPESALGQNSGSFPGLLTIQPDAVDQGYYNVDLVCSSTIK